MEWVLILFIHASLMSSSDSVSLTNVPMTTQAMCEAAGKAADKLVKGTLKEAKYICVRNQ
jgi:hypothetical protein